MACKYEWIWEWILKVTGNGVDCLKLLHLKGHNFVSFNFYDLLYLFFIEHLSHLKA